MSQNLSSLLTSTQAPRVCLLHGDEACAPAMTLACEHLYASFAPAIRHRVVADRYFSFANIQELLNDYSLFGDKNFIEVNYKSKPTTAQQEELATIIPKVNDNTMLVLTTEKLPSLSAAWIKLFAGHGMVTGVTTADATTIIKHRLTQAELGIKPQALELLLNLNQANMGQLFQEVNRLSYLHTAGSVIELKDIQNADNSEYNIYQLSTEYLTGNFEKSMKILNNIYHETADVILILWILTEDIRKLIKLKAKMKNQININQALGELKIWGTSLNAFKLAVARLPYATLIELLQLVANLDRLAKGVGQGDVYFELRNILRIFCQK